MKIMSLRNLELKNYCPICNSSSQFKQYQNGGQCNAHSSKEICFFVGKDKNIIKIEIIEEQNSIVFDFIKNKLILNLANEDDINLPTFDMDIESIDIKAVKQLLIFA